MSEREAKGLAEIFEGILIRHEGEDKEIVAKMLIGLVGEAFYNTERNGEIQ